MHQVILFKLILMLPRKYGGELAMIKQLNRYFIFLMIFLMSAAWAIRINVDPPSLMIESKPGDVKRETIQLSNNGDEDLNVKVYLNDWTYNDDGSKTFFRAGTNTLSLQSYISVYPENFILSPGKQQDVSVTLTMPKTMTGGKYGVIFFESMPTQPGAQSSVLLGGRIGTILYYQAEGTVSLNIKVEPLKIFARRNTFDLRFTYINGSNIHIQPDTDLIVLNTKDEVLFRKKLNLRLLPHTSMERKVHFEDVKLEPGDYKFYFVSRIQGNDGKELFEERTFTVK